MTAQTFSFPVTVAPPLPRRNNPGHWVDVPRFEQEAFCVDQAQAALAEDFNALTLPGVPRTGVVYSTTGTFNNGTTRTAGNSPSYPVADRLNISSVQGVMMRYRWRELEQGSAVSNASYTFARVQAELAQCLAIGNARSKRFGFILFLEVRAFDNVNPAPVYLQSRTSLQTGSGTYDMWRWNSLVKTRFALLVQALATQFDSHPCWEGIAVSETATGAADSDPLSGYTPEAHRDALIAESNAIANACQQGRHFFYQNFLNGNNGYLNTVINAGVANGAMVMAAPDILPNNSSLAQNYARFATFDGLLPKACAAQADSHTWNSTAQAITPPYDSMQSIFNYAKTTLKVNYLPWTWRRTGAGNHFADDAIVIQSSGANPPIWPPPNP